MYQKIYKVYCDETRTKLPRPVVFYANDGLSSVLEFHIKQQGKDYEFTADDGIRLFIQDPTQVSGRDVFYMEQSDQALVEVLADKKGIVKIKLDVDMVANHGKNLEAFVELYSLTDANNSCRFQSFPIEIMPADRSGL